MGLTAFNRARREVEGARAPEAEPAQPQPAEEAQASEQATPKRTRKAAQDTEPESLA